MFFADDDEIVDLSDLRLRVLRKTRRRTIYDPHSVRSKYIVIPRHVVEGGNHQINKVVWGSCSTEKCEGTSINAPSHIGLSHHYRAECEWQHKGGNPYWKLSNCTKYENVLDRRVHKYKENLLRNVKNVLQEISDHCNLDGFISRF